VKNKSFGEGAERIVFEMTEINAAGQPVGIPLVAKDSKYLIRDPSQRRHFHDIFVHTQSEAARLARKFNEALDKRGVDRFIPRIHFLRCCVYDCNEAPSTYLSEKRLNVDRYKKWNNNAGEVDGIKKINLAPVPVAAAGLGQILEGSEDEEEEDEDGNSSDGERDRGHRERAVYKTPATLRLEASVLDADVLQAFSH
jgi:hypothetical protein